MYDISDTMYIREFNDKYAGEGSAALTVIFILVVLVIVFRSVVTPLVSLAAVAFS
ncbi:MMPL family transporter [Heyndrickxia coagulans]|uniref:MMPL family transporter n=1 Tax=Heyndrickxia coagulans TaxID=1398 RepID=UPI001C528AB2|nr:MMPL family transporter [Heyndrickxia coagulans]